MRLFSHVAFQTEKLALDGALGIQISLASEGCLDNKVLQYDFSNINPFLQTT